MIASVLAVLGQAAQVTEEAPSSISTSDQVRAAVVLGVCLVAIVGLAALAIRQGRRRQRADRSGRVFDGQGGEVNPDQNE